MATPIIIPDNLPSVANAKLPASYEEAKEYLTRCERIDECVEWSDKALALASYARQAEDQTLVNKAVRIQARAIRRAGELLKVFDGRKDNARKQSDGADTLMPTQREIAEDAGMSKRQQTTAVRVSNVPKAEFEETVESESPPTVTALAERGKKLQPKPLVDLEGKSPQDFAIATKALGKMQDLASFAEQVDPQAVKRGLKDFELPKFIEYMESGIDWLERMQQELTRES